MRILASNLWDYSLIGIRSYTFSVCLESVLELRLFDTTFMEICSGPDPCLNIIYSCSTCFLKCFRLVKPLDFVRSSYLLLHYSGLVVAQFCQKIILTLSRYALIINHFSF